MRAPMLTCRLLIEDTQRLDSLIYALSCVRRCPAISAPPGGHAVDSSGPLPELGWGDNDTWLSVK